MTSTKRLTKSSKDRMLFGVAGGLAHYFEWDPVLVRVGFVVLGFLTGPVGILLYIVMAIVMPSDVTSATQPSEVVRENLQKLPEEAAEAGRRIGDDFRESASARADAPPEAQSAMGARVILALVLILAGALALLANFGLLWWWRWDKLWPLILIGAGALVIFWRIRRP